jgi:hypothetical protein
MASSVATRYAANVNAGRIERDEAQLEIVNKMEAAGGTSPSAASRENLRR